METSVDLCGDSSIGGILKTVARMAKWVNRWRKGVGLPTIDGVSGSRVDRGKGRRRRSNGRRNGNTC